ncbi:MAG: 4-alpha-glucanotransferase [Anaerolineae bacterium]
MSFERAAGILLHPTSLPGGSGIGEIGEAAYEFIDILAESNQSLWQILPLGPTGYGDSPYACFSALAGNPMLIDLAQLAEEGDVTADDLAEAPDFPEDHVDFGPVITFKTDILRRAARAFRQGADDERRAHFDRFCDENADWLEDFALFMALKDAHDGAVWNTWERGLVVRDPEVLRAWRERLDDAVFAQRYCQFQFFRQWRKLKEYAEENEIQIIGDIPIFVAYDSVDVWANPELYYLDDDLEPTKVAGVPPDYFSPTGQLWGNPLYDWDKVAENDYSWWIRRFEQTLRTVDIVRLDHFRGFAAYWAVPAGEETAVNGEWEEGPGAAFFHAIKDALGELPIIAEDLGHITEDVLELRETFNLPGMNVLQFAFAAGAANPYLPHNLVPNSVIYTGTHDNDTTIGWYESREEDELKNIHAYLGPTNEPINWALIRMAYRAVSDLAVVPLQDVMGLGTEARMNTPGKFGGNWTWRFQRGAISKVNQELLAQMALTYGRKEPEEVEERPKWM